MIEVLDLIRGTKVGQGLLDKMQREHAAQVLAEREQLVAERARLVAAAEKDLPKLHAAIAPTVAKVQAAEAALREAKRAYDQANAAYAAASYRHDVQLGAIDRQLRASAPDQVAEAVRRVWQLMDNAREGLASTTVYLGPGRGNRVITNGPSITRRLVALRELVPQLEALGLEALPVPDTEQGIADLFAALPPITDPEVPALAGGPS
jgi:hypothetical protein